MNSIQDYTVVGIVKNSSVDFVNKLFNIYASGNVVAFMDSEEADINNGVELSEIITTDKKGGWASLDYQVLNTDIPAQIVYSSGTEGKPKALLISHRSLADVTQRLNSIMQIDESIREYIGVPVTYSFGLGRCRAVSAAGGRFFIPENGFNPSEIRYMLDAGEINAISAVPSLWRMILQSPEVIGNAGKKIKWIEIGSQYMSRSEKENIKQIFPNATIIQHYGLTEASRSTFLDISKTEGDKLESVGSAYGDVEIDISQDKRIKIRGPHVAMGVIVNGYIKSIVDDNGWLITNDNGHIDDGYLYYDGRSDDIINLAGIKINPDQLQIQVEHSLHTGNNIAICRVDDALRGNGILVAVEHTCRVSLDDIKQAVNNELDKMGINAASSLYVQYVAMIPRTATGKVQRNELAHLYKEEKAADANRSSVDSNSVLSIFYRVFPRQDIDQNSSFKSLGGDSLNYVQLTMMLEKYLGQLPEKWDEKPVSELEASKSTSSNNLSRVEISNILRAIAILFIVGTHTGIEILGGGTLLLIFLVGYNYARFKSKDIVNNNIWRPLWSYIRLVLVPYYLLAIVYLVWNKSFDIDVLLLYANLVEANITVIFPFWFVQVLVQCLLILALFFSIPLMRKALKRSPWNFSISVLFILIAIRAFYPYVWDTSHLNNLVPLRFMAIIWLGWCFVYADTSVRKALLVLCASGFALIDTGLRTQTAWLVVGSLAMAYVPYILAPRLLGFTIQLLASATFYIFVFNGIFIYIVTHILKVDSYLLAFMAGLGASMLIWWATEYLYMNDQIKLLRWLKYRKSP